MRFLQVDSIDQAKEKLLAQAGPQLKATEKLALNASLDRVLAEDILCPEMVPDFRRSTVDGYAVLSKDTQGAGESIPVFLEIVEDVAIGTPAKCTLKSGQCAYVPTGAMLPDGADAMVMVEYTELLDSRTAAIYNSVSPGRGVVQIGEDARQNDVLAKAGTRISAKIIGVLASVGVETVSVYKPWRISIISTGDELIAPGQEKQRCQIYDVNSPAISAMAREAGMEILRVCALKDVEDVLEKTLRAAMADSDLVIVSGGSSQGKKDMTADLIDRIAKPGVWTHGLALKPGKPTIIGKDEESETLFIGLPGHPVAAMIVFRLIVLDLQRQLFGMEPALPIPAVLESNIPAAAGRATCQTVKLIPSKKGYIARPIHGKSGLMSTLTQADGFILLELNREGLQSGENVYVHLM